MKKILLTGAALLAAATVMTTSAQAQDCQCVDGIKCILVNGQLDCSGNIPCEANFNVEPRIPQEGPIAPTVATATSIKSQIKSEKYGLITITLDEKRPVKTTIESNSADERYPVTVELNFNAIATTESGATYESKQSFNYVTREAQSIAPFQKETLRLQNDVDFVDPATGEVAFTVVAGESSLTLGTP